MSGLTGVAWLRERRGNNPHLAAVVVVYLFVNLVFTHDGGPNVNSRLATMAAMAEKQTFRIDDYVPGSGSHPWTVDWAVKDGAFYSNKAPGSMLLGFPLYWLMDRVVVFGKDDPDLRTAARLEYRHLSSWVLSWAFQVLPFLVLVLVMVDWLEGAGVSQNQRLYFSIAALLGCTTSLYLNSWFGHGLSAVFLLGAVAAWLHRRPFLLGLATGGAILTEYSTALILLPGGLMLLRDRKLLGKALLGATLPGVLFAWYHTVCFGGPFATASQFSNPVFLDMKRHTVNLWGLFTVPRFHILGKLVFGSERGLLLTQPWTLVTLAAVFARGRKLTLSSEKGRVLNFALITFVLFLVMNSAFGGWHGGYAPGPRYLAPALPLLALIASLVMEKWQKLFWISLGLALVFNGMIWKTSYLVPPGKPILPLLLEQLPY